MGIASKIASIIIERFVTFFVAITIIFFVLKLMPGDPFGYLIEDPRASPEAKEYLMKKFGLDKPLHEQYILFLTNLFSGFLGISFKYQKDVMTVILSRLPWTLLLLATTIIISTILGLLIGTSLAWKRGSRLDTIVLSVLQFLRSLPVFWIGILLLLTFGYYLGWLPLGGGMSYGRYGSIWEYTMDVCKHAILPVSTLSLFYTARYTFIIRNALVDIFKQDYILFAKAKGLPDRLIKYRHGLKIGILPFVSVLAIDAGWMFGGAVLTETVFSYPGVGRLMFEAITSRDYPLLYATFIFIIAAVLIANTLADIMYMLLDPRVKSL